ncbi:MAG: type I glutamate--ammonia ligase [Deltaproteobacteria bacterium RIFOXYA12_FULL_61_11]|nr:MAG: type I glutamate--ammonia ligase [Deltaproteobacteria bacterium RIFOXYA12_FULL_61_11]
MQRERMTSMIAEHGIESIDIKYSDLIGNWYHLGFPTGRLASVLEHGIPFDGSSVPGMRAVESGDMLLRPDPATAILDPFTRRPTLRMLAYICDAVTGEGVAKDPRSLAQRAQSFLEHSGVADQSKWIPEFEFYLFNEAEIHNGKFSAGFSFTSAENKEDLPFGYQDKAGTAVSNRKGYHIDVPFDRYADVRQEMVEQIERIGCPVRYHHHEVGLSGQQEIETELIDFRQIIDKMMYIKDIIHNTALKNGLTATFMPKPLYDEPGSGMHFHLQLLKQGRNVFYRKGGYADLSDEALCFIGGILHHGRSLAAFTNPSTNSYKRLLPGFEAPVKLFFGLANRSAAIRIPRYANSEEAKRIEFRTSDGTCNYYFAMSALLMAGLDGIHRKLRPTTENRFGPYDDNVFAWSEERRATLHSIPSSLEEALAALQEDHEYLLAGGVFNEELLQSWVLEKQKEVVAVRNRPHPFEMNLYYSL